MLALLLLGGPVRAQEPEASPSPTVTRIQFQTLSDAVDPNDFSAQPKVLYRFGDQCGRLEEPYDRDNRLQRLILVNARNSYLINLVDKTGRHSVEKAVDFHMPIVADRADLPAELTRLEYGAEKDYFVRHGARSGTGEVEGVRYKLYDLSDGPYRLKLYCHLDSGNPALLDVSHHGKRAFMIRYLSYQTDVPYDPALFQPPAGVKFLRPGS